MFSKFLLLQVFNLGSCGTKLRVCAAIFKANCETKVFIFCVALPFFHFLFLTTLSCFLSGDATLEVRQILLLEIFRLPLDPCLLVPSDPVDVPLTFDPYQSSTFSNLILSLGCIRLAIDFLSSYFLTFFLLLLLLFLSFERLGFKSLFLMIVREVRKPDVSDFAFILLLDNTKECLLNLIYFQLLNNRFLL